jgi:hypothetical protein
MLGGEKWYGVELIKKEKTLEKVNEFMHSLIPLRTDVLSFSSWVVGMKCGHWFPMPHICANEATLKYFGRDRADVEVALSDERLPLVTVKLVDGDCPVDEWGRIKETIEKRVGKERIKEYKFNDKDMTAEYKLDLVFAHMVHATK